ncbi:hypothetical protein GQX73_g10780 [Xylaria multiplex]|uniref:2EXR domain-containing protein n=1 Tax=Xylaria multiplex TaxID=323545 RepID=A0A7C8ML42_9PEZI|nr:hypothetical protein GQX73_g10780 [Xylaria multiplex]
MNSEQHLQIINPVDRATGSFLLFPLLPAELRIDIWQLSLMRWRLINVELAPRKVDDSLGRDEGPRYKELNRLGNNISGAHYQVTTKGRQILSKLLRINSEARQAALRFYRVHIPCRLVLGDKEDNAGILPFNPEFDILHIKPGRGDHDFAHFLHDIHAYDIQNIGLVNLALDGNGVNSLTRIKLSELQFSSRAAFTQTVLKLQQMFFISIENGGRTYSGVRSGIHTNNRFEFHRSRPIMSAIPSFDRLAWDPRENMERDLSRVYVGTFDPRRMVCRWRELLRRWDIAHSPRKGPEYAFMVSTGWGASSRDIVDRAGAAEWLRNEEDGWIKSQKRYASQILRGGYKLPLESVEELEKAPKPAIGFWLFPIEAIGPVPGWEALAENSEFPWEAKRVIDMRRYRPQLCLARMP